MPLRSRWANPLRALAEICPQWGKWGEGAYVGGPRDEVKSPGTDSPCLKPCETIGLFFWTWLRKLHKERLPSYKVGFFNFNFLKSELVEILHRTQNQSDKLYWWIHSKFLFNLIVDDVLILKKVHFKLCYHSRSQWVLIRKFIIMGIKDKFCCVIFLFFNQRFVNFADFFRASNSHVTHSTKIQVHFKDLFY